jgi:hypothetical protein
VGNSILSRGQKMPQNLQNFQVFTKISNLIHIKIRERKSEDTPSQLPATSISCRDVIQGLSSAH